MSLAADLTDALRFLTILPAKGRGSSPAFGHAAFPLVGLLLGALAIAADTASGFLPERLRDLEVLMLWAIATGAIHYDGLADTLDALGGSTIEERLRIMRDGSVGSFAVVGLVLVVAAKLSALELLDGTARSRAILAAPALGRWAMLVTAFRAPAARTGGLGAEFSLALAPRALAIATATIVVVATIAAGAPGLILVGIVIVAAVLLRRLAVAAFGGITGDVLGASGEVGEMLALVFFVAS
jgi:adenosylcobinamide-GDP ribazoletransferase